VSTEHWRSVEAVGAAVCHCAAVQALETVLQGAPLLIVLKVEPTVHAVQVRSAVELPSTVLPWPTGQFCQATQVSLPTDALKSPTAHAAQRRFELSVGAAVSYCPAAQSPVVAPHVRSDEVVATVCTYSPDPHTNTSLHANPSSAVEKSVPSVHGAHWRSAVAVPATDCPSPTGQVA